MKDEKPRDMRGQHAAILDAVARGSVAQAETLARHQITQAADVMLAWLEGEAQPNG